jgi:hypothetical protein
MLITLKRAVLIIAWLALAFVVLATLGCAPKSQSVTGGSAQRDTLSSRTPTFDPVPARPARIEERWVGKPTLPTVCSTRPDSSQGLLDNSEYSRVTTFQPNAAPAFGTSQSSSSATTAPSFTLPDDSKNKILGGGINTDGSLDPFTFLSETVPKPRSGWWAYLVTTTLSALGIGCIFVWYKFGALPVWVGPLILALGVATFFITPTMITIVLVVLAILGTLAGVYFAFKNGILQKAIGKFDAAGAALASAPPAKATTVLNEHLDQKEQDLIPRTMTAAKAISENTQK